MESANQNIKWGHVDLCNISWWGDVLVKKKSFLCVDTSDVEFINFYYGL